MNISKQLSMHASKLIMNGAFDTQQEKLKGSIQKTLIHLRNATIELVLRDYEATRPAELFHRSPIDDICHSQERAIHYGVNIGDTISTYWKKRHYYDNVKAAKLAEIRQTAIKCLVFDQLLLLELYR